MAGLAARPALTIVGLGLLLLLSGNWILPLIDRDEPRFAEASREMLQRRDFIVPYLNGNYRFDKPPLIYWCQAASYSVLGDNPFAARLPSVGFSIATGLLLLVWGRRLGSERTGLAAALLFLTSLQVLIHGRLAVADMAVICFVTAVFWSGWEMTRPEAKHRGWWWLMFYVSLGLGFLAKGPLAWLPIGGLLLGRWFLPVSFRLKPLEMLAGLLLSFGIVAAWGIPALMATDGEFYRIGIGRHVVERSVGVLEGHGGKSLVSYVASLPLYLGTFFFSFFPWAFAVPGRLRTWWKVRASDPLGYYLILQTIIIFIVFSLVRTKLPHYTLPAFPCLALWLAWVSRNLAGMDTKLARGVLGMAMLSLVIMLGVAPIFKTRVASASIWKQTREFIQPHTKVASVRYAEPSLVWEIRKQTTNYVQFIGKEQAAEWLQQPGSVLILPTSDFRELLATQPATNLTRTIQGIDTGRFKRWDLTVVIVK